MFLNTTTFRFVILFISIIITFLIGLLPPKTWINYVFKHYGYYFIFFAFFLWVFKVATCFHSEAKRAFHKHSIGFFLSLIAALLLFNISPPKFRIFNDEPALVSTSKAMYEARISTFEKQNYLGMIEYSEMIDKRPLFFPFCISLLHTLFGYRLSNVFFLNFFCCWGSMFCLYLLIQYYFSKYFGYCSILLFISLPITFWYTSGGFEGLNTLFIILAFLFLSLYLRKKQTDVAELFFLTIILLAQIRYESIVFLLSAILFLKHFVSSKNINLFSGFFYLYPLLLIPVIWQRWYYSDIPLYNAIGITPAGVSENETIFSFTNLTNNTISNSYAVLGIEPHFGFSSFFSLISLIGLYILLKTTIFYKDSTLRIKNIFVLYGLCSFVLLCIIIFSYFWGDFLQFYSNRMALFIVPYMLFLSIWAISTIKIFFKKTAKSFITTSLIFHFLFIFPYFSGISNYASNYEDPKEYYDILNFLKSSNIPSDKILIISNQTSKYIINSFHVITFSYANRHVNELIDSINKNYKHAYALQRYSTLGNRLYPRCHLHDAFHLEKRLTLSPVLTSRTVISEIKTAQ